MLTVSQKYNKMQIIDYALMNITF